MVVDRLRLVGLLSAALVTFLGSAQDHTFSVISFYTQSAISLPLPFVSVLLMTQDFGRRMPTTHASGSSSDVIIAAKLLASMIIAIAGAACGVLISVLGTSGATPAAEEGRWDAIGMIILGSGLVQLIGPWTSGHSAVAYALCVRAAPAVWPHGRSALGSGGRHCACVGDHTQCRRDTPCAPPSRNRRTLNSSSIG
jgi:hypothetical protein